ncbi:SDR family NAD(P)-dependent oxidoreductase [Streptomyces sp. NPDC002306]
MRSSHEAAEPPSPGRRFGTCDRDGRVERHRPGRGPAVRGRRANVSPIARGREHLEEAANELSAAARAADVADQAALTRAIAELEKEQGLPCDVLITSAGLARPGHFLEQPDEVLRQMMEVDYFGTPYAIRAVAPGMVARGHGSVVAVSFAAGVRGDRSPDVSPRVLCRAVPTVWNRVVGPAAWPWTRAGPRCGGNDSPVRLSGDLSVGSRSRRYNLQRG